MSVIAARVFPDKIEMSSDSVIIKDDLKLNFDKMREFKDNLIIGGCGDADELSLMFIFAEKHTPSDASVSSIMDFMSAFLSYKEDKLGVSHIDNEYLIAYKNKLFIVDGMFVSEVYAYTAIGAGSKFAITALYLGMSTQAAVDTACNLCVNTAMPVKTLTLKVD